MLRQRSFFSDSSSDFGGADPAQALRMDGFDAPQPPTLGSRLRESGISAAETAIAGIGLGANQYADRATIRGLGRGEQYAGQDASHSEDAAARRGGPAADHRQAVRSGALA